MPVTAPYGSWDSPITADLVASSSVRLAEVEFDGDNIYWLEGRPAEGGRNVIVRRRPDGTLMDVNPPPFNARTRVHEYGGGALLLHRDVAYFSNFADQRLYRQPIGGDPQPLTPRDELRYADGIMDSGREAIFLVREDHRRGREARNEIVRIDLAQGGEGHVIATGNDFYSSPRLNANGSRLAWLTWNHPNMPWDGTELWIGSLTSAGQIAEARRIAGGGEESIFQPEWSPDGSLYFVSDLGGWWNLYRWRDEHVESLLPLEAEFGGPQWVFGMSTYVVESAERIVCSFARDGLTHLASLNTATRQLTELDQPYTYYAGLRGRSDQIVCLAASPTEPLSIVLLNLDTGKAEVLRRSSDLTVDPAYVSRPEPVCFATTGGQEAHALFYRPVNPGFQGLEDVRPPLLVRSHGGPTGASAGILEWSTQYWTSRGFAVVDVNYGGSTGYGRAYRERLNGEWGVVDVDDCVNAAWHLARLGLVDGERMAIRGGSAGGYTTLACLAFRDAFRAGASYYGVSDLEALARETHKFESRYLDRLVGPYPERRDIYMARSPIHFADRLSCPIIFFQGLEDKVVPPNQAERMVEAVRKRGLPVAYVAFEGEQHGFRRAENIQRALEAELYFYSRIFDFTPRPLVRPVPIENL